MESEKITYYENTEVTKHREFIIAHNNCVLCGTVLELRHLADGSTGQIKEEAFCPHCEVKTRAKIFTLN